MRLTPPQITKLAARIWSQNETTYGILDGAGTPGLLDRLYGTHKVEFECLYSGEIEPDIAEVAPYIVRLQRESNFAEWALGGWGQRRGIFVQAPDAVGLPALRRHFRKLNTVYGPDFRPLMFRYYDPRVLRMFLGTCSATDAAAVFGPVSRFIIERGSRGAGVVVSAHGGRLAEEAFVPVA